MEALRFNGSGSEYFKIWIVNMLLMVITLGIYYPWAKVRNRRYFYNNTSLDKKKFEYHATGKQLFIGFIIAISLLVIYNTLGVTNSLFGGLFLFLFILALPWLIWKSLTFNMKMTSFSDVHFSFDGRLGKIYGIFLGYPLLFLLSLSLMGMLFSLMMPVIHTINPNVMAVVGLIVAILGIIAYLYIFAFIKKKSIEYFIENSHYGQGIFKTELETTKFFTILLKALTLVLLLIALVSIFIRSFSDISGLSYAIGANGSISGEELLFTFAYFMMIFILVVIIAYLKTRERTYIYENTILDNNIAFESTLRARVLAWVMLSNIFLVLITFGLAFPWAKVRVTRLMLEHTLVDTEVGFDDYITQKQEEVSALADQIGDLFDLDADMTF
jgi:uncharacterized membrane protein YjgN (DUF898 family)